MLSPETFGMETKRFETNQEVKKMETAEHSTTFTIESGIPYLGVCWAGARELLSAKISLV